MPITASPKYRSRHQTRWRPHVLTLVPSPSAYTLTNSAEGGTSGTSTTLGASGNTGGASGNYFDNQGLGSSGVIQFSNTQAAHGSLSYQFSTVASSNCFISWNGATAGSGILSSSPTLFFREYLYFTANPSSGVRVFQGLDINTTPCGGFNISTAGKFTWLDQGANIQHTSTNTIPLNQWFRIEGYITGDPVNGVLSLSIYDTKDSTTATESFTTSGAVNTNGWIAAVRFGIAIAQANIGPFWIDDLGISNVGLLGPSQTSVQYNQSLVATVNVSGLQQTQINPIQTATVNTSATQKNGISKFITGTVNVSGNLVRGISKTVSGTVNVSAATAFTKIKLVTLLATVNIAASQKISLGKIITVAVNVTSSVKRALSNTISGASVNVTGSIKRAITKSPIAANVNISGSVTTVRSLLRTLMANVNVNGNLIAGIAHLLTLAATVNVSATIKRGLSKFVTGTVNVSSALTRALGKKISGNVNVSGSQKVGISKFITGTVNTTGVIKRAITKGALVATVNVSSTMTTIKVKLVVLVATVNVSSTVQRGVGKFVTGSVNVSGAVKRGLGKYVQGTVNVAVSIKRGLSTHIVTAVNATGNIIRAITKTPFITTVQAVGAGTAQKVTGYIAAMSGAGSVIATVWQYITSTISGTSSTVDNETSTGAANISGEGVLSPIAEQEAVTSISGVGNVNHPLITQDVTAQISGQGTILDTDQIHPVALLQGIGTLSDTETAQMSIVLQGAGAISDSSIIKATANLAGVGTVDDAGQEFSALAGQGTVLAVSQLLSTATMAGAGSVSAHGQVYYTSQLFGAGLIAPGYVNYPPFTLSGEAINSWEVQ